MFKRKPWHRLTAILLSLTMLFSSIPSMAFAEGNSPSEEPDAGIEQKTEEEISLEESNLEDNLILEEEVSYENAILEESTETSTVFDLGDGRKMAIFHGQQVRYEDKDGNLTDYDPALVAAENTESENGSNLTGYAFENKMGDSKQFLPEDLSSDTPVLMEKDDYVLTMAPYEEKGKKDKIKVKKEKIVTPYEKIKEKKLSAVYEGEGYSYEYQSMNQGVKETLVLHEIPAKPEFSYLVTAKGMEAELTESGAVIFRDKKTKEIAAYIDAPFMNDATGQAYSEAIETKLARKASGKYILTYILDEEYLQAEERVYPVSVDPTAAWKGDSNFTDVYVISGSTYGDTNFYDTDVRLMVAGKGTEGTYRTYVKLPGLKDILDGYFIDSAYLTVYESGDCDANQTMRVNRVTGNWNTSSITWNNKPGYNTTAVNSFTTTGTQYKAHQISVRSMVRNFINSMNNANYGFVLRNATASPGFAEFYGSRTSLTSYRPKLVVTYSNPPATPTVTVENQYINSKTTLKANWSGLTSGGLDHVEYRIAQYALDGTLENSTYVPWTEITSTSSSGSISLDVSAYTNKKKYRIYIRGVDVCDNTGTGNYAEFWTDRLAPSIKSLTIEPETTETSKSTDLTPTIKWEIEEIHLDTVYLYMDEVVEGEHLAKSSALNGSVTIGENQMSSGTHRFCIHAVDKAGNLQKSQWKYYYADTVDPDITSLTVTPSVKSSTMTTPTVSWELSDNDIKEQVLTVNGTSVGTLDNTVRSWTGSTGIREGENIFILTVTDYAGNEKFESVTYHLDRTKPVIKNFNITPDSGSTSMTSDNTPVMEWEITDAWLYGVYYSIDGGTYKVAGHTGTGTFTLPEISGDGEHSIKIKAVDVAGNDVESAEVSYFLDTTKPVFSTASITPQATFENPTNNMQPEISWNITEENLDKVYYRIDNPTTPSRTEFSSANSGTFTIPVEKLTTTGEHTIYLQAVDKTGNYSDMQTLTYYLDVTKPVLSGVSTSPQTEETSPVRNLTPEIAFSRGDDPLGRVYYQINKGDWKETEVTSTGTFVLPEGEIITSGAYTISVKMSDKAGNESDPVSTVYHVDIDAPVFTSLEMTKSSFLFPSANRAPVITWNLEEAAMKNVYYSVNGGEAVRVSSGAEGSVTLPETVWGETTKGKFTISVYAEDAAGNTGEPKTLTYYLKSADDPEDYLPKNIDVNESYGKRVLTWNLAAYDGNMASYELHRGTSEAFVPSQDTLVTDSFDVTKYIYIDNEILEAGTYFYKIVVNDLTGDAGAENYVSDAVSYENTVTVEQFSNRTGLKDYLSYLEIGLPTGTMHVEESSGNLVYEQNDYSFTAPAFSMDMDRTYNSMSKSTSMVGAGWTDSYHQEIYTCGDDLYFVDTDGSTYFFERQADDNFACAETREFVLAETNDSYTITSKDEVVSTFNKSGQLTSMAEPNGYILENVYDQMGRLAEIRLTHGETEIRNLEFNYGENSYLLDSVNLPDASTVQYNYNGENLTSVEYGGITYAYQYDGNGLLNTVYDGEDNPYTVGYTDGKVAEAAYPDGEKYQFSYYDDYTEIEKLTAEGELFYTESTTFDPQTGKMISHTDPAKETVSYAYGDGNNPYLLTESSRMVSYYALDEEAEKIYESDLQKSVLSAFIYDGNGNITSETAEDGSVTVYAYDDKDRVTEEETARDGVTTSHTTYLYDTKGNVVQSTDHIIGQVTVYTLDDYGNVLTETVKEEGITLSTSVSTYDIYGNVLTTESTEGDITTSSTYTYDIMGKILTTASSGTETTYAYDETGREIQSITEEEGVEPVVTTKAYDNNGTLVCEDSTIGTSCEYSYDERNRVISQTVSGEDMETRITTTEYGTVGTAGEKVYVETVTTSGSISLFSSDNNSQTQTRYIDGTGKVIKEVDDMLQTEYTYDKAGNVLSAETATSDQGMAILENRAAESTNTDDTVLTLYNEYGEAEVYITEPEEGVDSAYALSGDSLISRQSFDGAGNLRTETSPKGITATYSYDGQGRLTGCNVDGEGPMETTVSYSLTPEGNTITTITDANGNVRTETVSAAGLVLETRDIASEEGTDDLYTKYTYDTQGRKTREEYSDGSRIEYVYTSENSDRVSTETAYRSDETQESVTAYTYDSYGRTNSITVTREGTTISTTSWTYDAEGKKLSESVLYGTDTAASKTEYVYDVFGRLAEVTYPDESGLGTLNYTYDTAGNISKISSGEDIIREYGYVHMGQVDSIRDYTYPGSAEYFLKTYSYDNNGRTTVMSTQNEDDAILETFSYEYDKNSQIIKKIHVNNLPEDSKKINETTVYTYDDFGRLTQSKRTNHLDNNTESVMTYGYDNVGNRSSMTEDGTETTYIYNSLNQLMSSADGSEITTYTYDDRGNQITETKGDVITESTYSVCGEMLTLTKKAGNTVIFSQENQYNHDGIRIAKKEDGTTRHYYYDNGIIAYTEDGTSLSSANIVGPEGQVVGTYRGDDYHVYLKDIQGSTTNIVKDDGTLSAAYEYSDFGETEELTGSSFDNEICYTGAVYDDTTGLYYMNARYYNPENGRFISQDTYRGALDDYSQWHLYAYCTNNPITYIDPSGRWLETVLDVASLGYSVAKFVALPSWKTAGDLLWDVGATFIPFMPGSYVRKGAKITLKYASKFEDFKKGRKVCLTVGKYKELCKAIDHRRIRKIEIHHIIEKRFNKLNLPLNDYPSIPISKELHKKITARWKDAIPRRINYKKVTKKQLLTAVEKVYHDMPELKKVAIDVINQYYRN